MQRFFASALGRQTGLGLALALAVMVATVLFNFLGVITCAALVGLLAGATRRWRWQVLLVSLVFPLAIVAYLAGWKTDIPARKIGLMAVVCFGTFWLTYLVTFAVLYFEKSGGAGEPQTLPEPGNAVAVSGPAPAPEAPACLPELEELQGAWAREVAGLNGPGKKIIEITRDRIALSIVSGDGQVRHRLTAGIALEHLGPFKILRLCSPGAEAKVLPVATAELPCHGIYRITGGQLTFAENFEATANGCPPVLETYTRTGPSEIRNPKSEMQNRIESAV